MKKYIINREYSDVWAFDYIYKSRNKFNQIITCECWLYEKRYFNFSFCIKTKRKSNFNQGKITGKGEIKSLIWAKNCLLDFYKFMQKEYKGCVLEVWPANERLRNIYEYYLLPYGFKVSKTKDKYLYIKIK